MIPELSFLGSLTSGLVGDVTGNFVGTLPTPAPAPAADGFGAMLQQLTSDAMNKLNTSESTAIQGIEGKASVQQVVASTLDAQTTLQTVLAIRDKIVSAYQEVSRMAI